MSAVDVLIPAAVIVGCLLTIASIVWFRRERTPRWSIQPATDEPDVQVSVDPADLARWHRAHAAAVAAWISSHEDVLRRLGEAELAVDLTDPSLFGGTGRATENFKEALGAHPSAVMRAELSAMQVAGEATLHAVRRADYGTGERQHLTYVEYRNEWVSRLRQFSLDDPSLAELRRTLTDGGLVSSLAEASARDDEPPEDPAHDDGSDTESFHPERDLGLSG